MIIEEYPIDILKKIQSMPKPDFNKLTNNFRFLIQVYFKKTHYS